MAALLSHLASSREERAHLKAQLDLLLTGRSPDEGPKGLRRRETPNSVGVTKNSRLCLGGPKTPNSVWCDRNLKPSRYFLTGRKSLVEQSAQRTEASARLVRELEEVEAERGRLAEQVRGRARERVGGGSAGGWRSRCGSRVPLR